MTPTTKIRIARSTGSLEKILEFYGDGLGLDLLGKFEDHDGFSGIMLGKVGSLYHLEFTIERGVKAPSAPSKENLLVFYLPEESEWQMAVDRMQRHGFMPVKSHNPYWELTGKTFEDFEGYRTVLVKDSWNPKSIS